MPKVKVICRTEKDFKRETKLDIQKVVRSTDHTLHPFQRAREYQRAVIAAKIDKIFSKPFVAALNDHSDGVSCFCKSPKLMNFFASGCWDGQVRLWDVQLKKSMAILNAHSTYVKGIAFSNTGKQLLTCAEDNQINVYSLPKIMEEMRARKNSQPQMTLLSKGLLTTMDHSYQNEHFVTGGDTVQVWSQNRTSPVTTFDWGMDTVTRVKFNPVEANLIACTSMDRGIFVHDIRGRTSLVKTTLLNKSSAIAWNPQEPFNFTVGNEDGNCYTFDMRKMDTFTKQHKDHIGAVMDLDYSPTGRSFVTGSFDKTVRIFDVGAGRSKQMYHAKRMQKVMAVCWTIEDHYLLSGSEDANIRIWKSDASAKLAPKTEREQRKQDYRKKL
jgi:WD repeat and SOF domain-containing protein 1